MCHPRGCGFVATMDLGAIHSKRAYDVAFGVVVFAGLYQGLVPLVARSLFDADQRFAPALWLPAPWWWIACLAIVLAALALLAMIDDVRDRHFPAEPEPVSAPASTSEAGTLASSDGAAVYGVASGIVFLVGIYNGIAPFVARLVFGGDDLLLALPLRLQSPWWWLTSIAVLAVSVVLLVVIDEAKKRHLTAD